MARVDASVAGGFPFVVLSLDPLGALETYASTRLSQYGQVVAVNVARGLASRRYTATVSFLPSTGMTTEQARDVISGIFRDGTGGTATNVSITSAGEAPQQQDSAFDPLKDASSALITLAALVAVIVVVRAFR